MRGSLNRRGARDRYPRDRARREKVKFFDPDKVEVHRTRGIGKRGTVVDGFFKRDRGQR